MIATIALAATVLATPNNDRPDIEALCKKIATATATRNWKMLANLSTPDFKQKTLQGQTLTFKQLTKGFDQALTSMKNPSVTYKILTFKSDGKTVIAEVYWSVFGTQTDMKGKPHKVELSDSEQDTFRKVKGRWLESTVIEHKDVQKVDGKTVPTGGVEV